MKKWQHRTVRIADWPWLDGLEFLADPVSYINDTSRAKPSFIDISLTFVQDEHPSLFHPGIEMTPARAELKGIFDGISQAAAKLLEQKEGMRRMDFYNQRVAIARAQEDLEEFRKKYLNGEDRDNVKDSIFQKFFVGSNTLDAIFIDTTSFMADKIKRSFNAIFLQ